MVCYNRFKQFSESGLIAQREFNVELKDKPDIDFALNQFENCGQSLLMSQKIL